MSASSPGADILQGSYTNALVWRLILVIGCMVFARSAAMAFNRYLDRAYDANNPRTMGHDDINIMKGAAYLAFNDMRDEEDMRRVANEFDLVLAENHGKQVIKLENKIYALEGEVRDLKAKLSRYENPDNPNYTEEEMEAMDYENK